MESGPDIHGATGSVIHDVVLADGEVIEVSGANAYVQEGPLTTFFQRVPPTLRAVPAGGADRLVKSTAG